MSMGQIRQDLPEQDEELFILFSLLSEVINGFKHIKVCGKWEQSEDYSLLLTAIPSPLSKVTLTQLHLQLLVHDPSWQVRVNPRNSSSAARGKGIPPLCKESHSPRNIWWPLCREKRSLCEDKHTSTGGPRRGVHRGWSDYPTHPGPPSAASLPADSPGPWGNEFRLWLKVNH